jgi:hypothetical protein
LEFSASVGFIHKECYDAWSYDRKSKSVFLNAMKATEGVEVLFLSFLALALGEGELSRSCCGHFTTRGVSPSTYCERGFVGPYVFSVLQRRGKFLVHVKIRDGSLIIQPIV